MKFVVATFNADKLGELRELIGPAGIALTSLSEIPGAAPPPETGETLIENARIKARRAREATGLAAIADDTGLEVDALGGRPGVHAARFAGPGASYADNLRRLLEELAGVPPARRTARFRTIVVASLGPAEEILGEGVLEGRIAERPRGRNGFGYDPVFEIPELGRTLAELTGTEKNQYSHRARAVRELLGKLAILGR
jgi:XTP/dITP diphosphohydrolase